LIKVARELKGQPQLKMFLLCFFFYNMGTQTVMYVATLFGTSELKLGTDILITIILIIQFVAIGGAYLFSSLSKKYGNFKALAIATTIWIFICFGAYFCDEKYGFNEQYMFMGLAAVVGLVMGGIQSLSRSTYSKLLPETEDHTTYFSFFDVTEKIAIVLGTFIFGFVGSVTDSLRNSIFILAIFFLLGYIVLSFMKKNELVSK